MPEGILTVIAFLSLGYLLFAVEMVVPGGILGILGLISVLFGCWQAFQMGFIWGSSAIFASLVVSALLLRFFLHSRTGKQLTLSNDQEARTWKAGREEWKDLVGRRGITLSPLRPSGVISIDGQRFDVVSDNEFLAADQEVQVVEVEGRRIVVEAVAVLEAVESADASDPAEEAPQPLEKSPSTRAPQQEPLNDELSSANGV